MHNIESEVLGNSKIDTTILICGNINLRRDKMHLFMFMYLMGLMLGVLSYALTYYFSKKTNYKNRSGIISLTGVIVIICGFLVGGFEGMPFGVMSLGFFTVALLLFIFGGKEVWKKCVLTIIVIFVLCAFVFSAMNQIEYWTVKKSDQVLAHDNELGLYIKKVKKDSNMRGFEVFPLGEDAKAIVLSLGGAMEGSNIEVLNVEEEYDKTIVKVKSFYNNSSEPNPFIIIGLDRIKSEIEVIDTDGTMYEEL